MIESQFIRAHGMRVEVREFLPLGKPVPQSTIVMLHEGLGSAAMWKDFPQQLADKTHTRVVAYSRFGYGQSDPPARKYRAFQMHEFEALEVLPAVLRELDIANPVLFGHSDGASIALIHAASNSNSIAGVIALAPHLFVEDMCIAGIENARLLYQTTDLPQKLGRYHNDPDRAFWLWHDVWLDPAFRAWNLEHYLRSIRCPILAIQGYDDEYGTMEQLERVARGAPHAQQVRLPACGHSPHRDQPCRVLETCAGFMLQLGSDPIT